MPAGRATYGATADQTRISARMTRQHAEIAGRRLAWLQAGQGAPVVLLHAFPLHAGMWQPQLAAVPHGWRLIAPDLRGFGESSGKPALTVDDHAEDVLALLRYLDIERAVIGGLSIGGYITFALYRRAAQRFRAIVLADTRADADTADARAGREAMQASVRAKGAVAAAEAMLPKLLRPRAQTDPALAPLRDRVREMMLAASPAGIINALDVLKSRPDSTPTLALITPPALIVVGQDDQATPPPLSAAMQQQIATATSHVIADAGHLSNMEQPAAFNAALWTFAARL
jgi:3-oxoadipate enol-lactonase